MEEKGINMKKICVPIIAIAVSLFCIVYTAHSAMLYVDVAPNTGTSSTEYLNWWEAAKNDIKDYNYTDMSNGYNSDNVGTYNFEVEDTAVYNFGDYGSRLTFIYWVPGKTTDDLEEADFQISVNFDWSGATYSYTEEAFGSAWVNPITWENDGNQVFGTAGIAWEAIAYNDASLAAEMDYWRYHQGDITLNISLYGQTHSITAYHAPVPEPSTFLLFGVGLAGLAGMRKRRKM